MNVGWLIIVIQKKLYHLKWPVDRKIKKKTMPHIYFEMNSNQINNVKSVEDFEVKNDHSNEIVRKNPAFYAENTLEVVKRTSKDLGMALEKLGGQLCFDIYKKMESGLEAEGDATMN